MSTFNLAYNCSNCGWCWQDIGCDVHLGNRCPHCNGYEAPYTFWIVEQYDEAELGTQKEEDSEET